MERKDSENRDNFFASLNQLMLSLEPAIKEAGSVSAAEDILTHLEATDENFHRFGNRVFCWCHCIELSRLCSEICLRLINRKEVYYSILYAEICYRYLAKLATCTRKPTVSTRPLYMYMLSVQ